MVKQGFHIGNRDWWVMVYYDVQKSDLDEVEEALSAAGCSNSSIDEALEVLSHKNAGYTYTDMNSHASFLFISHTTSAEQMFDSIVHEIKHLVEHVSEAYGLDPKEELAAYLQGEVGRKMFPAAALVMCPCCHDNR